VGLCGERVPGWSAKERSFWGKMHGRDGAKATLAHVVLSSVRSSLRTYSKGEFAERCR
jgi:hypothetical protein